jgi:hypothetical protein
VHRSGSHSARSQPRRRAKGTVQIAASGSRRFACNLPPTLTAELDQEKRLRASRPNNSRGPSMASEVQECLENGVVTPFRCQGGPLTSHYPFVSAPSPQARARSERRSHSACARARTVESTRCDSGAMRQSGCHVGAKRSTASSSPLRIPMPAGKGQLQRYRTNGAPAIAENGVRVTGRFLEKPRCLCRASRTRTRF